MVFLYTGFLADVGRDNDFLGGKRDSGGLMEVTDRMLMDAFADVSTVTAWFHATGQMDTEEVEDLAGRMMAMYRQLKSVTREPDTSFEDMKTAQIGVINRIADMYRDAGATA